MIGFFPIPFPDEILYSVFARYHIRSRNRYVMPTLKNLFGHAASRVVVDLPNKLGYLVNQLPPGSHLTVKRLIDDHTLFPFYSPFLPQDRIKLLRRDMTEKSPGGAIHGRLGILTSNFEVEYLRFCPLCAEDDIELYSEPYWHRIHQLPGILVCPYHSVFLENSNVKCSYHGNRETLVTARNEIRESLPRSLDLENRDHLTHLYLAKQADWLLRQNSFEDCGPDFFRKRFLQVLFKKNLATIGGTISINKVEAEFEKIYSPKFLALLSSSLDNKCTWLRRLLQASTHLQHPIRNLLFLHFLDYSLEEFIELPDAVYPFGKPPFPCLNIASDHYRELKIETSGARIQYSKQHGVSGIFKCACGFIYQRYGWDEKGEKFYEYDSVISYGETFDKAILNLLNRGLSKKEIAGTLKTSVDTVNSHLRGLLNTDENFVSTKRKLKKAASKYYKSKRDLFRNEWKKLRRNNPNLNRTDLRKLNPTIGNWLYTKDMQWLDINSPRRRVNKAPKIRIDWKKKDEELSFKTENLALEILNSSGKPVRVSVTGLANRLKFTYIVNKRPDCIPQTIKILHKYAESTEDFIARRVYFAANCFIEEKQTATYWQLIMRACVIKPHLVKLPKVQVAITDSLNQIKKFCSKGWKADSDRFQL